MMMFNAVTAKDDNNNNNNNKFMYNVYIIF